MKELSDLQLFIGCYRIQSQAVELNFQLSSLKPVLDKLNLHRSICVGFLQAGSSPNEILKDAEFLYRKLLLQQILPPLCPNKNYSLLFSDPPGK